MIRTRRGADTVGIASCLTIAVGNAGTVSSTTRKTTVVVPNLDSLATDTELQEAFLSQHGLAVDKANIRLRLHRNGLKRARLRLAERDADRLVGKRLKVALTVVWPFEEQRIPPGELVRLG
uniref:Uncharacterized protein n=1 Tax=Anopheles dirus TaxID=7168 RepID=A0A182N1P8_9DIPT